MTRFSLRLPQRQARLVALAVAYHLARPGSELDRETMREYEHGLAEVAGVLEPQLDGETATLELFPLQVTLLATALSSVVNELKMYSVFDTMAGESDRPRSTAPGFDDRLRSLFPEVAADPAAASDLAGEMAMLRRQLPLGRAREAREAEHRAAAERAHQGKKAWQFWKRCPAPPPLLPEPRTSRDAVLGSGVGGMGCTLLTCPRRRDSMTTDRQLPNFRLRILTKQIPGWRRSGP